jgi:hypothetical protein
MTLFGNPRGRDVQYSISNTFVHIKTKRGDASSRSSSCPPTITDDDVSVMQSPMASKREAELDFTAEVDNFLCPAPPPLTASALERHTSEIDAKKVQENEVESPTQISEEESEEPGAMVPHLTPFSLERHTSESRQRELDSPIPNTAQIVPGSGVAIFGDDNPFTNMGNPFSTPKPAEPAEVAPKTPASEMTPLEKAETIADTSLVGDAALSKMRYQTQTAGLSKSQWVRVVHSGYGNDLWRDALRAADLEIVVGSSHPEGVYVRIPEKGDVESVVNQLQAINSAVRKKTTFPDMKRANKSRLQFKNSVIIHASDGSTRSTAATERSDRSGRSRTAYLEQFLHAPGFKEGYPERGEMSWMQGMQGLPPHMQHNADPNNPYPMMFAAQPTPGQAMAPIYMCVGMMGAQGMGYPGQ